MLLFEVSVSQRIDDWKTMDFWTSFLGGEGGGGGSG